MTESDQLIKDLFVNKFEMVINLPPWMLPSHLVKQYREIPGLAIVEMAGRDSVAAAIKCVKEKGLTDLLPVYTYTGTEYGEWSSIEEAVRRLSQRLKIKVHDLIVIGSPGFRHALNGRFISTLIEKYGYFTPCIGCHSYLHSTRIPLATLLGRKSVISGERESHDGREKINQIPEALDAYEKIANRFNIPLLMPLRHVKDGREVEDILGFKWGEGMEQLGCTLSGNYRNIHGGCNIKKKNVQDYLNEFVLPCTDKIIASYVGGNIPDHERIAKGVLDGNS